jgi:hypothetical protein
MEIDEDDFRNIMANYWYFIQMNDSLYSKELSDAEIYWKKMQEKYKVY